VLARLANELDVTSDYLMDGSMDDRVYFEIVNLINAPMMIALRYSIQPNPGSILKLVIILKMVEKLK